MILVYDVFPFQDETSSWKEVFYNRFLQLNPGQIFSVHIDPL